MRLNRAGGPRCTRRPRDRHGLAIRASPPPAPSCAATTLVKEIAVKVMPTASVPRAHVPLASAIAREVTGARWNGLLWFGLTGRTRTKGGTA